MLSKFYSLLQNLLNSPMQKEFFGTTQLYFQKLGINLKQTTRKYPISLRNLRTFCFFGFGTVASVCYTCFLAKTFEEYIASFYVLSSMLICLSIYSFVFWTQDKLIKIFTDFSQYIAERKFKFSNQFFIQIDI